MWTMSAPFGRMGSASALGCAGAGGRSCRAAECHSEERFGRSARVAGLLEVLLEGAKEVVLGRRNLLAEAGDLGKELVRPPEAFGGFGWDLRGEPPEKCFVCIANGGEQLLVRSVNYHSSVYRWPKVV